MVATKRSRPFFLILFLIFFLLYGLLSSYVILLADAGSPV
jgi:hypothetical protein